MTDRAVPNLPSRDFSATLAFYQGFGFTEAYRDSNWMILRRGELQLEFFPYPDLVPQESSFMCSVRVADLSGLYAAVAASGVVELSSGFPRLQPVAMQPWGQRAGFLTDIDGTQLQLIEEAA